MPGVEIITANERELVEARIAGLSRKQVAERFGVSTAAVRAAERKFAEDASDLETERAIIGEQLSRITQVFLARAREGDVRATELLIAITKHKAELLGLNAPRALRIEDQRPAEQRPSSIDRIEAALARLAAEHNGGSAEHGSADDGDKPLN